ncbi:MAG: hypothetical protein ACYCYE_06825 [Clostridia bacterium]
MPVNDQGKLDAVLAYNLIEELENLIDEMYSDIQKMDEQSCIIKIDGLFIGLQRLTNMFHCLFEEQNSTEQLNSLNHILIEVEKSMINKDYNHMCDILVYEIKPLLERWKSVID